MSDPLAAAIAISLSAQENSVSAYINQNSQFNPGKATAYHAFFQLHGRICHKGPEISNLKYYESTKTFAYLIKESDKPIGITGLSELLTKNGERIQCES